jgi:hypothetical protein
VCPLLAKAFKDLINQRTRSLGPMHGGHVNAQLLRSPAERADALIHCRHQMLQLVLQDRSLRDNSRRVGVREELPRVSALLKQRKVLTYRAAGEQQKTRHCCTDGRIQRCTRSSLGHQVTGT